MDNEYDINQPSGTMAGKEANSELCILDNMLPEIRSWKVGKKYAIQVEVEMVSLEKGSTSDPAGDTRGFTEAEFRVLSAKSIDLAKQQQSSYRESMKRALMKAMNEIDNIG